MQTSDTSRLKAERISISQSHGDTRAPMIIEKFNYKGFIVKVSAHELFHGLGPSGANLGWYTTSVAIAKNMNGEYRDHEETMHPGRISVNSERAMDYGKKYARHVIDEEILYSNLSKFLTTRPI